MAVLSTNLNTEPLVDQQSATLLGEDVGRPSIAAKMPRKPAPNVAELSARLFGAYTIDGGSIRLAGCTLEPVPIVHVKSKSRGGAAVAEVRIGPSKTSIAETEEAIDLYLDTSGDMLDAKTIRELELDDVIKVDKPPRLKKAEHEHFVQLARQHIADAADEQIEIIWCRYAAGKLRFTIGQEFVELPFADWAVRLTPPSYVCQHSGLVTFHLAAVDDGRIVAVEEIAVCEQTGRRALRSEWVTCSVTGKQVWGDATATCPATRFHVLRDAMISCPICSTRVSPQALIKNRCQLCADLEPIGKDDPRLAQVFSDHPRLAGWQRWKIATTPERLVLEAIGAWRRLLIVLDSQSLQTQRLFQRNRVRSSWRELPRERWPDEMASRISSRGA
jgi:hypothetical protein